jgi:phosphoserine phosphatase
MGTGMRWPRLPILLLILAAWTAACSATSTPANIGDLGALIEPILARNPQPGQPPLVVFDFDDTLIAGDISMAMVALLAERRHTDLYSLLETYQRPWDAGRKVEACGILAAMLAGMTVDQARGLAHDALARELARPTCTRDLGGAAPASEHVAFREGLRPRQAMRRLVSDLLERGVEVWVVSASPQPVVEVAARELFGIPPEQVAAVRTRVRDGRLTDDVQPPVTVRQGKREAIQALIGRRPALVFGDTWTDFEMLTYAERGVLIGEGHADLVETLRRDHPSVTILPAFPDDPPFPPCP